MDRRRLAAAVSLALAVALAGCAAAGSAAAGSAAAGSAAGSDPGKATSKAAASKARPTPVSTTPVSTTPVSTTPVSPTPVSTTPAPTVATAALRPSADGTDSPAGFWYGSDSWPIPVAGSGPYRNPSIDGSYGGYIGMAGNWARWQGCGSGNFLAWSAANAQQADTNRTRYAKGIGTAVYWYMGGPGVDPHWNGTAAEASAWGAAQARQAISAAARDHVTYPVLFMDIEMPGIQPAPDNGWNRVYTSPCSGVTRSGTVTPGIDRAEFNGFDDYLTTHSDYKAGVYSEPGIWAQIFGTGSAAQIPHTYEWTYWPETANLDDAPRAWCLTGRAASTCAEFFGGVTGTSPYAIMWQWSGGGGVRNALGDFDQIRN